MIFLRSIGDPSTVQHEYLFIYTCVVRVLYVTLFFFFFFFFYEEEEEEKK